MCREGADFSRKDLLQPMTVRTRKLLGAVLLLVFLAVYTLTAMLVAAALQVNSSKTVELAFYVIAGLLWVLPAGLIIRWAERGGRE
jgi:hypothetical protein